MDGGVKAHDSVFGSVTNQPGEVYRWGPAVVGYFERQNPTLNNLA
jgi:hypothetical protein